MNSFHLSASAEWGTPVTILNFAKFVLQRIDCDPATSAFWNRYIGARRIYTSEKSGLAADADWYGNVLLNPPGDKSGKLIQLFWEKAVAQWLAGKTTALFWVGFNLEQLVSLQKYTENPLVSGHLLIPKRRLCFLDESGEPASSPTHGNYLLLLPPIGVRPGRAEMVQRFCDSSESVEIGQTVR